MAASAALASDVQLILIIISPVLWCSFHEFVGRKPVIGGELFLGLHQPRVDIEDLRVLHALLADERRIGADLANGLERRGENLPIEGREALLQELERVARMIRDIGLGFNEARADGLAERPALLAGLGLR